MKNILITGGAGFIGSSLGKHLMTLGYNVVLLDDLSYGYKDNILEDNKPYTTFIQDDILSDSIYEHTKNIDCVFHLAAISALPVCQADPAKAISINVLGTAKVLEACRINGVKKVIFASTSAIYENNTNFPCKESDETNPSLIYSISKKQAEMICQSYAKDYGMDITITRYYNVYGPNHDFRRKSPPFIAYLIKELINNRIPILHSDGSQKRDYVYIDDVNNLNATLVQNYGSSSSFPVVKEYAKIYNVASGIAYSVKDIVNQVQKALKIYLEPQYVPSELFWHKYPELFTGLYKLDLNKVKQEVEKFTLGCTEKAKLQLGFSSSINLEQGIALTVQGAYKSLNVL